MGAKPSFAAAFVNDRYADDAALESTLCRAGERNSTELKVSYLFQEVSVCIERGFDGAFYNMLDGS